MKKFILLAILLSSSFAFAGTPKARYYKCTQDLAMPNSSIVAIKGRNEIIVQNSAGFYWVTHDDIFSCPLREAFRTRFRVRTDRHLTVDWGKEVSVRASGIGDASNYPKQVDCTQGSQDEVYNKILRNQLKYYREQNGKYPDSCQRAREEFKRLDLAKVSALCKDHPSQCSEEESKIQIEYSELAPPTKSETNIEISQ